MIATRTFPLIPPSRRFCSTILRLVLRLTSFQTLIALATASSSGDFGYTSDPADDGGVLYPDQSLQSIIKMEHVDRGGGGFNSMDGGAEKGSLDTREGSAITISELFRRPLTAGSLQESKVKKMKVALRAAKMRAVPRLWFLD